MRVLILSSVLSCALIVAACTDSTAPHSGVRRYVGYPPTPRKGIESIGVDVDWYNCASWDSGQTWSCEYDHTDYGGGGGPDYWDYQDVFHTSGNCSMVAQYCDNNFQPTGGSSPYTDPREVGRADDADDAVLPIPHCPASPADAEAYRAYCAGHTPNTAELALIRAALDRMRQIGGICEALAAIGDAVLARATLHIFPQAAYSMSGHAPVGGGSSGANSWTILSEDLTNEGYDASHYLWFQNRFDGLWYKSTLQTVLAHELDHLNGANGHISENGVENQLLTPNTRRCSDVDMGSGLVTHP